VRNLEVTLMLLKNAFVIVEAGFDSIKSGFERIEMGFDPLPSMGALGLLLQNKLAQNRCERAIEIKTYMTPLVYFSSILTWKRFISWPTKLPRLAIRTWNAVARLSPRVSQERSATITGVVVVTMS
jgi:hypothetical protein